MHATSKLERTLGKTVTEVVAGGTNGSIINIEFDHRYLLTIYCAWRLERAQRVLTGSNESADPAVGDIPIETKKLLDDKVQSIVVSEFFDLKVQFASKTTLNVFCDVTPKSQPADYDENWAFCDPQEDSCLVIDRHCQAVMSKYGSEPSQ